MYRKGISMSFQTALAVSVNLRTFVQLKETDQVKVVLDLPDIKLHNAWEMEDISKAFEDIIIGDLFTPMPVTEDLLSKLKKLANIPEEEVSLKNLAIISFLYIYLAIMSHKRKDGLQSLSVKVTSNLPTGSGLGSSAAYSVSLAAALLTYSGVVTPINDENDNKYMKWTKDDLELINKWGFEAERIIHGTPSGIDNSVSTYGGAIHFKRVKDTDGEMVPQITPLQRVPELRILLVNTRIPRITKILVANVKKKLEKYPDIINPIFDAIDGISIRCENLFKDMKEKDCDHIYREIEELIDINQSLLGILGVSHPSLEQVVQITSKHGLHSKLTGAGGGGCALTLIAP
uniref:Mevalonate kinase n=1 Tax=Saccoglossus kowalevskii TaxID=10224 RepID=A0ABM0MIQ6_SACKO